ncbi:hypothetical protein PF005_g14004 [Phytophthora fragariae]|uniref:Uncharacterized protein n=1 Tax=Phytophthora fragariae TaxID=53985 RepID=A0A6A3JNM0_9STRA|nr:hypothetical protein PF003_g15885 [Phytophthora fragariae]KAE8935126.1 hypothetical protein PF009_g14912 [Phytophthora fragariae]KAE8996740.1 hypothetical protein PF011_g15782 [Phytophthora fragariae]KAE9096807.1 hypothetical protein PF007_g16845 [Phytophthora fragariae]KAE9096976.1 hypothetical protein PF010_g16135 [Phytophthora fragariae]
MAKRPPLKRSALALFSTEFLCKQGRGAPGGVSSLSHSLYLASRRCCGCERVQY